MDVPSSATPRTRAGVPAKLIAASGRNVNPSAVTVTSSLTAGVGLENAARWILVGMTLTGISSDRPPAVTVNELGSGASPAVMMNCACDSRGVPTVVPRKVVVLHDGDPAARGRDFEGARERITLIVEQRER